MRIAGRLAFAVSISILAFVSACQTTRPAATVQMPVAETPQDQALSKAVLDRLVKDKKVDLTGIEVVSNGGTVYLSGTVGSLDAREQALKIAWSTPGVKSVVNSLVVQK